MFILLLDPRTKDSRTRHAMSSIAIANNIVSTKLLFSAVSAAVFGLRRLTTTTIMTAKKALLVVTDGAEEMETVISADVLRRAEIEVTIAGLNGSAPVKCSRNVVLVPDASLEQIKSQHFDALVLPGGMGAAKAFASSTEIGSLLKAYETANRTIAVICASPIALAAHNIAPSKRVTSHPSVSDQLKGYTYSEDRVVVDGSLITSRGPGTAFEFALAIVGQLVGQQKVDQISQPMILKQ